jgi:hypothetical protein
VGKGGGEHAGFLAVDAKTLACAKILSIKKNFRTCGEKYLCKLAVIIQNNYVELLCLLISMRKFTKIAAKNRQLLRRKFS